MATNRSTLILGVGAVTGITLWYLVWQHWKTTDDLAEESTEGHPEKKVNCIKSDYDLPPFKWKVSVEDIKTSTQQVLDDAESNLNNIALNKLKPTFENTIRPLMLSPNYKTNHLVCQSKFLQHASPNSDIREISEEAGKKFASFKASARMRSDVYEKVLLYHTNLNNNNEKEKKDKEEEKELSNHQKHFIESILNDFKKGGLDLDEEKRNQLQTLLSQDTKCCAQYKNNLGEDSTQLVFTRAELRGLPESFMDERVDPTDKNSIILYLKYPDIIPVLSQCEVSSTRERINQARECEAYGNNLELVAEGAQIRYQIAKLLNKKSWSHYVLKQRMAETPEKVLSFLSNIKTLSQNGLEKDLSDLRKMKRKHLKELSDKYPNEYKQIAGDGYGHVNHDTSRPTTTTSGGNETFEEIQAWDIAYYHSIILKNDYGVDNELIREYFPINHVIETTMEIYQTLLSLTFTEIPYGQFESWHDEVRLFIVHDATTKKRQGHFYLDLHPRVGKYGHAAIFHLLKRNGEQTPVDCMLCNLPPPTKVYLLLSLFCLCVMLLGHIMHGLCTEGEGNATSLAKCPRDFVEAPSQMLENWCWDPIMLSKLSKHHITQESIPDELIQSMLKARSVHASLFTLRQVYLSLLDMSIHGESPPSNTSDLQELVNFLRIEVSGINNPEGCNMLRNFGHLMNQYSAGYYGYLWAEVLSADMFETCFSNNITSLENGLNYRHYILAPGGTGKIIEHVSKFLGREPDEKPFLKARNII
mmetsp:Transcript_21450/g.27915  ORF Transcript_21450/g.27915 Transcript_21450/m.27915 type:complete len:756 (+) Transcript_21450:22-2289(+)